MARRLAVELVGTAFLVIFGVGAATLSFGFHLDGGSTSAGVVMTALAFGLVLLGLVYAFGPVSGCHVNPAVTIGFVAARRMSLREAAGYWIAQFAGGIAGALVLWGIFSGAKGYSRTGTGLGTDGYGSHSLVGLSVGGAFAAEVVLTLLFVLVVLAATGHEASAGFAGLAIGVSLTVVHLLGIPLTGTSVNPARSLGPALIVGGDALDQLWLFIVAPLVGGLVAAVAWIALIAARPESAVPGQVEPTDLPATGHAPD